MEIGKLMDFLAWSLLGGCVIFATVHKLSAESVCDDEFRNICSADFTGDFKTTNKQKCTRVDAYCRQGHLYANKCASSERVACIKNQFGETIGICAPYSCYEAYISCRIFHDRKVDDHVWIEVQRCGFGFFKHGSIELNAFRSCEKDQKVQNSTLFKGLAFCSFTSGYYHKNGEFYMNTSHGRLYLEMCIDEPKCPNSTQDQRLPDGSCSPIHCPPGTSRSEKTNFTCTYQGDGTFEAHTTHKSPIPPLSAIPSEASMANNPSPTDNENDDVVIKGTPDDQYAGNNVYLAVLRTVFVSIGVILIGAIITVCVYKKCKASGTDASTDVSAQESDRPLIIRSGDRPRKLWDNRRLTDRDISSVANCIGKDYPLLAFDMGIKQTEFEQIQSNHSTSLQVQIMHLLLQWRGKRPDARPEDLREIIERHKKVTVDWDALDEIFAQTE